MCVSSYNKMQITKKQTRDNDIAVQSPRGLDNIPDPISDTHTYMYRPASSYYHEHCMYKQITIPIILRRKRNAHGHITPTTPCTHPITSNMHTT